MPSASPPDGSSPDGEVVEVFTGDTLEEAMATAVAALGPDLTVRRARKVRAGVRGLLGRDRYEVLAVPPDGPPVLRRVPDDDEDAVGSALEALLDAADQREASGPQARPVGRPVASRPLAARPVTDELPPPLRSPAPGPTAPLPPAPRSSGSPLRRGVRSRPVEAPPASPVVADADAQRRRGRPPTGPLADRSPHPDPAVADHPSAPDAAPAAPAPPAAPAAPAPPRPSRQPAPPLAVVPEPPDDDAPQVYDQEADELLDPDDDGYAVDPEPAARPARRAGDARRRPAAREREARPPETDEPDDEPRGARAPEPARSSRRPAAPKKARSGWSIGALSALGVPDQVLDALPGPVPRDDLAWVVALTSAIERCVPQPGEPDEQTPVVVSGHGLAGAVAVLEAGCRGAAPGTITHAGRTAPATATELALVLRHHVTGGS